MRPGKVGKSAIGPAERALQSPPAMRAGSLFLLFFLPGCAAGQVGFAMDSADSSTSDDTPSSEPSADDATVTTTSVDDAGAIIVVIIDDGSPANDDGSDADDAPTGPPFDAGDAGICTKAPSSQSLMIVELMIESTPGTGDHGEWLEVASTLECAIDLKGLHGDCPTGAKVNTFAIDDDVWIPALGTFVVADSTDPAVNHDLPGLVIPWAGEPGDVLRNEGATVTLLLGNTIIDSVTYPNLKLAPGNSVAFPRDCAPSLRPEWSMWRNSTASWFPAFTGTPNAPNNDVHCATENDD
jgi:hypothetical protein